MYSMKKRFNISEARTTVKRMLNFAFFAFGLFAVTTTCAAVIGIDAAAGLADEPASLSVGDKIDIMLPDGKTRELSITAELPGFGGRRAFSARMGDGPVASSVILSGGGMYVEARDMTTGILWKVFVNAGVVSVEKSDMAGTGRGECIEVEAQEADDLSTGGESARKLLKSAHPFDDIEAAPAPVSIDMMLVFDNGAREWISGRSEYGGCITNFAIAQVAKMNTVLENTGLHTNFWYRLVGVMTVDATMTAITQDSTATLKNGADSGSGPYGEVKTRRDACGADCVSLIIDTGSKTGTTGIGYTTKGTNSDRWTTAFREWCYSVCAVRSVADEYTLSHEVGHNMGLTHSKTLNGWSKATYEYANGYNFEGTDGKKYHTIMAYDYDHAGGSYTYGYIEIPYFSSPIHYYAGAPVGSETADATRALRSTCSHIAEWREHSVPYNWEVAFLDSDGGRIREGTHYFSQTLYVTLTNYNSAAEICYTIDGGTRNTCPNGQRLTILWGQTVTAYTVVNGVAQPATTVVFKEGQVWSGEAGRVGCGTWIDDGETLAWGDSNGVYDKWAPAVFLDIAGVASATVSVHGAISPYATEFLSAETAYVFEKGRNDSSLRIPDAAFAPSGDLTFNLPVNFDVIAFTNPANHTLTFNAPFGQIVSDTSGYCTNMIGIGGNGTLVVSPGKGKTQTFDYFNNVGWFYNNATFRVGTGTVVFKGPAHERNGIFGSVKLSVDAGGTLFFDMSGRIAKNDANTAVTGGGTTVFRSLDSANSLIWTSGAWTGTVALTNVSAKTLAIDAYGNANSTVRLTGVSGYPGSSGNTNITFGTTVELVDGADGSRAWTIDNGYSSDTTTIYALKGSGTLKTTKSPSGTYIAQGITVRDASGFTGSLDIVGTQLTFGSTIRKGGSMTSGAIYVDAGQSVTNFASWSVSNLVVNGELVKKGTLSVPTSVTFGDGASFVVDALPADGVVLASGAITTNGALSVSVLGDANPYVTEVVDNGATKALVVRLAPLPETVTAAISLRYFGEDGWEDRVVNVELPSAWVKSHYPALDTAAAVAAKYGDTAANGAAVWQCYMLGLDPTDADSDVSLSMTCEGGKLRFSVEGLGETHEIDGVVVRWYLKTTTDLTAGLGFPNMRETTTGLSPEFAEHDIPDSPRFDSSDKSDCLFYKLSVSFVSE